MPSLPERSLAGDRREASSEAPRTIIVGQDTLCYLLQRTNRRTIGLTIDRHGLRVRAPQRASPEEIEAAILRHGQWVTKKLEAWRTNPPTAPLPIVDGTRLPLLGRSVTVCCARGDNRWLWNLHSPVPTLTLCLRSPEAVPCLLEQALRAEARERFTERLALYAARLGVAAPRLSLSAARTRWGSCSLRSGIRLNWRLIHFPLDVVDYVVAHELAHLQEMNHSPRFWSIVARLYPDYRHTRAELKRLAATCPRW